MFSPTVKRLEQREVLEHHADAELARRRRAADLDGLALPADLALVRPHRAVDDLHQRRLARAVLAQHRVDFAGGDGERHVVVGLHGRVRLLMPASARRGAACAPRRRGGGESGVAHEVRKCAMRA